MTQTSLVRITGCACQARVEKLRRLVLVATLGMIVGVAAPGAMAQRAATAVTTAKSIQTATSIPAKLGPPGALLFAKNRDFVALSSAMHLGANLPAVSDYSATPVYVDLMHQARKFGSSDQPWDALGPGQLGSDGWPTGNFGLFLMVGMKNVSGIGGVYKMSFQGQARVEPAASDAQFSNQHHHAATNLTTMDITLKQGTDQLAIAFTDVGPGGVKNVKIIRPGYDPTHPPLFTTEFLRHISRFKTVRLMDWTRTNDSMVKSWDERALTRTPYLPDAGVPWEHIVELANITRQDIWVNIPALADDDYVLNLARLFKNTLNPSSKIYVEYSNEVWNGQFQQFKQNHDAALADAKAHPKTGIAFDGVTNEWELTFRRVAQRGKDISDIFRKVYGDDAMMTRIRPVIAGQVVRPALLRMGLDYISKAYGSPSRYFYAMAGAPYFNMGQQQQKEGLTPDEVLKAFEQSVDTLADVNYFEDNVALAHGNGLPFIAYEGGSDTFGPGSVAAKRQASMDPRLEPICRRYMKLWYEQGGEMFMWFTAGAGQWTSPYGSWELTTDMAKTDAPKIKCLDAVIAEPRPRVLARNRVPGMVDAMRFVGSAALSDEKKFSTLRYKHPGDPTDYLIYTVDAGPHNLVLRSEASKEGNQVEIAVNGIVIHERLALSHAGWDTPADSAPVPITLSNGFNTIRITTKTETSGFMLRSLLIR